MSNRYDWGIYNPLGGKFNFRDKERNIMTSNSYMLVKTLRMFDYEGLPDSIDFIEMEKLIQTKGYAIVVEHEGDIKVLDGGVGGEPDEYNRPTKAIVNNPALGINKEYTIGIDCVVISNDYLSIGVLPLFNKYNTMIVENEITMIVANYNKRVENIISVADDVTGESARMYLKKIEDGDVGYIQENKLFESLKSKPTGNNNGVRMMDLIEYQQYLKSNLLNEIGLDSIHNMKKERMVVDEVNADSDSIYTLVDSMLECRVVGVGEVNRLFNTNISVEFGGSWKNRQVEVEEIEEVLDEEVDINNEDGSRDNEDEIEVDGDREEIDEVIGEEIDEEVDEEEDEEVDE